MQRIRIDRTALSRWWLPLLLLILVLLFNGLRGLWAPDEGRYVAAALEMLRRHDYVGVYLNDDQPHLTKPPLTYWMIAASIASFGKTEFAARLPNALAFWATALLLLQAGRLLVARAPWLPMLVYATMLLPFQATGAVTTDTFLTLFTTFAGLAFLRYDAGLRPRRAAVLMWLGFGLAFLTKGTPGLMPLIAFVAWVFVQRDWRGLQGIFVSWGVALFLFVGLTWYFAVSYRFEGLLDYFLHDEVAGRIASSSFERNPAWYGGFKVYLPTIMIGTLPWLPLWFLTRARGVAEPAFAQRTDRLLLLWIGLPLVVFFCVKSRLPLYLLPLFPPLSLWLARRLEPIAGRFRSSKGISWIAVWIVALLAVKIGFAYLPPPDWDERAVAQQLARVAGDDIGEVVYVDRRPHWGLSFYLGAQVDEVLLARTRATHTYQPLKSLAVKLAGEEQFGRRVFVVRDKSARQFEVAARSSGKCPEFLGKTAAASIYLVPVCRAGNPGTGYRPQ
ncbi:MAG: ArnT family glycosyltransferase [Burkholderiales bacterium]